jgi:uncharacterized protein YcbK (DUF882 family)
MTKNYFKRSEEWCPCCHSGGLVPDFRDKLNKARQIANVPFILTSAFRCSAHNAEVGGSESSSHLAGLAVDIKCTDAWTRCKILSALFAEGFNRIGIGKTFIHVDDDMTKPTGVVWLY